MFILYILGFYIFKYLLCRVCGSKFEDEDIHRCDWIKTCYLVNDLQWFLGVYMCACHLQYLLSLTMQCCENIPYVLFFAVQCSQYFKQTVKYHLLYVVLLII